jgi:hypothetical protein
MIKAKTEQERRWFREVIAELRKAGVRAAIQYAGSEKGHANAISPLAKGNGLFLVCGELSKPGAEARGVIAGCRAYTKITPIKRGFRLIRDKTGLDDFADEYNARKGYTWCLSSPRDFIHEVDRQGNLLRGR